jgi:glycosyltransferase involved in cell wall biosynthesis
MTGVVLATLAASDPMGQQLYETQLLAHLPAEGVLVRRCRVRSMRSTLPGEARAPLSALSRAPAVVQRAAARFLYGSGGALVHRCDLRLPAARHEVVTVHDLAPLRFPDEGEIPARAADSLRRARAVIAPSQFAADELRALLGVDAQVIHNGLDPAVWDAVPESMLDGLELPARFVLHSGGATRRKNLAGLADAWNAVAAAYPDVELVLCGPRDTRRIAQFADLPRVRMLGKVERSAHLALMSRAAMVVVPSTYEGFGFPALEAMARETAVVAAECGSLPEICGDVAVLTEPTGDGLAAGLASLLDDAAALAARAARGPAHAKPFTWQRSARAHADVYAAVSSR